MRRFIAILSVAVVFQIGLGCRHVGGKCDCQPGPGDAHSYTTPPLTNSAQSWAAARCPLLL